ncbi:MULTISPECIES: hypothetical protein [unclassified Adlercreutzia]|uniref:hypothetical protein n=1 Tax=unclassified Adlercreutzia TaxID=2636013 RepID=UPI0013E9CC19|nr:MULTISPECIES: hypothetical protein [unclassified Adlercreutzia]
MAIAVIVAIIVGFVSLIPFRVATKKIRTVNPTHSIDMLAPFLLTIIASFVILIAGMIACKLIAPDVVVAYSVAELLAFVVGVIVFGLVLSKRR